MSTTVVSDVEAKRPDKRWYVIHTYSGYENKVKANLEHRIESMGMEDKIFQVLVPMEDEIEIRQGQRHTVQKKVFPGYVLVEMILDPDSWFVVRNTPGVTSFVGGSNIPGVRSEPVPLDETCPKDGAQLVRRQGRFGEFISCSNYPKCDYIKRETVGVTCHKDGGDIVVKKSKRGKVFYGCANYPKCDVVFWDKPVDQACPQCGAKFLLEKTTKKEGTVLYCQNEECDYKITAGPSSPEKSTGTKESVSA